MSPNNEALVMAEAKSDARGTILPCDGYYLSPDRVPIIFDAAVEGELLPLQPLQHSGADVGKFNYWASATTNCISLITSDSRVGWHAYGPVLTGTNAPCVFKFAETAATGSAWREHRRAARAVEPDWDEILQDIYDLLDYTSFVSDRAHHAGLAAVARLADLMSLSRPTILRMGGVPSSTFYAWQKSPRSAIRTPTVTRLLRLQAQIALLNEVMGTDRMRAWVMSAERFTKLQGDDSAFLEVIGEAGDALANTTQIRPRPRLGPADYEAAAARETFERPSAVDSWPGARQAPQ
jgi:hypothetical protein